MVAVWKFSKYCYVEGAARPGGPARPGMKSMHDTVGRLPFSSEIDRAGRRTRQTTLDLAKRPRRNRKAEWSRRLMRESHLGVDNLIWPLFLIEGEATRTPVASMPGVERMTIDEAVADAQRAASLGIPAIALFPYIDPALRDGRGSEAHNPENLVCRALRAIKRAVPEIGLIGDVALDPYTAHGHDGLLDGTEIVNDPSVDALVRQALVQAQAGADIVAPSDMMDGRIGAIREALDADGRSDVQILAYTAKYASAFYGPFRDAIGTSATLVGDKRTYQMDPANTDEALREVELDIEEGADMLMVKPGMPYLDVLWRIKERFRLPTFAYQVSGEYAMIEAAAANGWIDRDRAMAESLMAFRRAGADAIVTYYAAEVAERLRRG
jgi:porphobilinogen synthase